MTSPFLAAWAWNARKSVMVTGVILEVSAQKSFLAWLCAALAATSAGCALLETTPQFPHSAKGSGFVAIASKGSLEHSRVKPLLAGAGFGFLVLVLLPVLLPGLLDTWKLKSKPTDAKRRKTATAILRMLHLRKKWLS